MTIEDYFKTQKMNSEQILKFAPFGILCPIIENIYNHSFKLVPPDSNPLFGKCLLICHKSFLSSASLIAQAQPDDAVLVTRRAIEVVRIALAIKLNPKNADKWTAYEERSKRWDQRLKGEKPKPLFIKFEIDHPIINELMHLYGIFSDAGVHFTPEYFDSLGWNIEENKQFLNYFMSDNKALVKEIILFTSIHSKVLQILDECMDFAFRKDEKWNRLMNELIEKGKLISTKFNPGS